MNPDLPLDPRQALEASLTALLLGELPADQEAFLRQALAQDAELARMHERLKQTIGLVRETESKPAGQLATQPAPLKLSETRRQELLQRFKTVAPREFAQAPRFSFSRVVAIAAVLVLLALLASMLLPALSKAKSKSMSAGAVATFRQRELANRAADVVLRASTPEKQINFAETSPNHDATVVAEPLAGVSSGVEPGLPYVPTKPAQSTIVLPVGAQVADASGTVPANTWSVNGNLRGFYEAAPASGLSSVQKSGEAKVSQVRGAASGSVATRTWGDFDNDGLPDLSVAPSAVYPSTGLPAVAPSGTALANNQVVDSATGLLLADLVNASRELHWSGGLQGGGGGGFGGGVVAPQAQPVPPAPVATPTLAAANAGAAFRQSYVLARSESRNQAELKNEGVAAQNGSRNDVVDPSTGLPAAVRMEIAAVDPATGLPIKVNSPAALAQKERVLLAKPAVAGVVVAPSPTVNAAVPTQAPNYDALGEQPAVVDGLAQALPKEKVPVLGDEPVLGRFYLTEGRGDLAGEAGRFSLNDVDKLTRKAAADQKARSDDNQLAYGAREEALRNAGDSVFSFQAQGGGVSPNVGALGLVPPASPRPDSAQKDKDRGVALDASEARSSATEPYSLNVVGYVNVQFNTNRVALTELGQKVQTSEGEKKTSTAERSPIALPSLQAGVAGVEAEKLGKEVSLSAAAKNAAESGKLVARNMGGAGMEVANLESAKRELEELQKSRTTLYAKISQEKTDLELPKSAVVEVVDAATAQSQEGGGLTAGLRRALTGDVQRSARIKIERDQPEIAGLHAQTVAAYDPYFAQTEFEVIQSEAVLGKVIDELKLDESWGEQQRGGGKLDKREAIKRLKDTVELVPVPNSALIDIRVKSKKPDEAAKIANAIAGTYQKQRLDDQRKLSLGGVQAMKETVADLETKVALAQAKVDRLQLQDETGRKEVDVATPKPAVPAPIPQPEVQVRENSFSTFSLNISDVSFKLAAASLEKGVMPEPAGIRSEEFINAFDYRDPEAPAGTPIAFAWERARYPFAQNRDLLRLSLKTAAQGRQPGRPLNLVLLLDNSGSMERADRVRIIQEALRVLATQLQPQDKLSVILFARTARLWVDGVPGNLAAKVAQEVGGIAPQGGTNLEEAMNLAYQTALRHYQANGINRVVLLTDGAANLGDVEADTLKKKVEDHRKQGVAFDCFGIGWEGYNDDLLEVLSRNGDGRYGFINTPEEAATEFAGQLAGALHVAASDVKVQVEFNAARVTAYRQIGYAKHQLTKEQFRDNTVDAAEIGAAEAGNALYVTEVNPRGEGPLAIVRVRYKLPGTVEYYEREWAVPYVGNAVALEQSSPAMRLAATASGFSEWLAGSPYATEVGPDALVGYLRGIPEVYGADQRPKKLEWMIRQVKSLAGK